MRPASVVPVHPAEVPVDILDGAPRPVLVGIADKCAFVGTITVFVSCRSNPTPGWSECRMGLASRATG